MENIIEVSNLSKYYKTVKAVDDISFSIAAGKVFALLGPNGAGKTTTVEILEGLRRADSGRISYFGKEIAKVNFELKEKIGVQLQNTVFFESLTVKETLKGFSGLYEKKFDIDTLVKKLELEEKINSKIKTLSGGQKQRLAIAVALVNDPDIVFLDEPTTGLDPQARRMLWDFINELKTNGKTIVLTTHYMEEAEYLSDFVNIVDHGKVIASGTVEQLIDSIGMKSIIRFHSDKKFFDCFKNESLKIIEETAISSEKKIYEIQTDNVEKALSNIFETTRKNNLLISEIAIRQPNLEDVFLKLTGRTLRD